MSVDESEVLQAGVSRPEKGWLLPVAESAAASLVVALALTAVEQANSQQPISSGGDARVTAATAPMMVTAQPTTSPANLERRPGPEFVSRQLWAQNFEPDPLAPWQQRLVGNYVRRLFNDPDVVAAKLSVTGYASDEGVWCGDGSDVNLGEPSSANEALARERAALLARAILGHAKKHDYDVSIKSINGKEVVLGPDDLKEIERITAEYDVTEGQLIADYNHDRDELGQWVDLTLFLNFSINRGAIAQSELIVKPA